jgi:hypothetical protein
MAEMKDCVYDKYVERLDGRRSFVRSWQMDNIAIDLKEIT